MLTALVSVPTPQLGRDHNPDNYPAFIHLGMILILAESL